MAACDDSCRAVRGRRIGCCRGPRPLPGRGVPPIAVFVDTSALYALLDRSDGAHAAAAAALPKLHQEGERLVTHNYVVVEAVALVQSRLGLPAVAALRDDLLPLAQLEWVDRGLHARALAATIAAGRRDVSLVDRVSFELMRDLGIRTAFAFDDDFATEGFGLVPSIPQA